MPKTPLKKDVINYMNKIDFILLNPTNPLKIILEILSLILSYSPRAMYAVFIFVHLSKKKECACLMDPRKLKIGNPIPIPTPAEQQTPF